MRFATGDEHPLRLQVRDPITIGLLYAGLQTIGSLPTIVPPLDPAPLGCTKQGQGSRFVRPGGSGGQGLLVGIGKLPVQSS